MDQSFGWQNQLERGNAGAMWPGSMPPTLRMNRASKFAQIAAKSGFLSVVPRIFDNCTVVISPEDELKANEAYWAAVTTHSEHVDLAEGLLREACAANPYVGEPHIVLAQLLMQRGEWDAAEMEAKKGLDVLFGWGTCWDKRMPYRAWVAWARCLALQVLLRFSHA